MLKFYRSCQNGQGNAALVESRNSVRAKSCPISGFTSDTGSSVNSTSADISTFQNISVLNLQQRRSLKLQRKVTEARSGSNQTQDSGYIRYGFRYDTPHQYICQREKIIHQRINNGSINCAKSSGIAWLRTLLLSSNVTAEYN